MLLSVNGETAAAERKITQFSNAHMAILALGMFIGMMCQMVHPHCWNSTVTWIVLSRIEQDWAGFCFGKISKHDLDDFMQIKIHLYSNREAIWLFKRPNATYEWPFQAS